MRRRTFGSRQRTDLAMLRGHRQATRRPCYSRFMTREVLSCTYLHICSLTLLLLGTWPPHWGKPHKGAPAPGAPVPAEPSRENIPALAVFSAGAPTSHSRDEQALPRLCEWLTRTSHEQTPNQHRPRSPELPSLPSTSFLGRQ